MPKKQTSSKPPSRKAWLKARKNCRYMLNGNGNESPSAILSKLARLSKRVESDLYGQGPLIEDFEKTVARYFGKESATFFPSGIMAQMAALKTWSTILGSKTIFFHPLSHIEMHEERSYSELMNLSPWRLCPSHRLPSAHDFKKLKPESGTVLLEIPQRDLFFQCPSWDELKEIAKISRRKKLPLHLDGARILEAAPGLGKSPKEIAQLFDSVYISFYKILGGISGAMLIGDSKWISETKIWRRRMGGTLVHSYPVLISARHGWKQRITKMRTYHRQAMWLSKYLRDELRVTTIPETPQSNSFCVVIPVSTKELKKRAYRIACRQKIWFPATAERHPITGEHYLEIVIGDSFAKIPKAKLKKALKELFEHRSGTLKSKLSI